MRNEFFVNFLILKIIKIRNDYNRTMKDRLFTDHQLRRLIWPLVIEQFLAILVGLVDTIMVSSFGDAAVSGLSIVDNINMMLITIFSALATGGTVIASQYLGQWQRKEASESIKQLVYAMLFISGFISLICLLFQKQILVGLFGNVENEVMENAITYFWLSCLSYPGLALYNCGAAAFRAQGNSKISMNCSLFMNGFNIVGNAILIYGFQMGVAGAGAATLVARWLGMLVILKALKNKELPIHIDSYWHYHPNKKMIKAILSVGIPSGFENGLFQAGKIMVQRIVTTLSTVGIAAYALTNNMCALMCIPGLAIGLAMITVVGQCAGKEDYVQARYYIKKLMKYTYVSMIALDILLCLLTPIIFKMYSISTEAKELARICTIIHTFMAITVWPAAFTLPNALRASNNAQFTMIVSVLTMFIFRIGGAYVFVEIMGFGLEFIYIAMLIDWIFRAGIFILFYRSGKWEKEKIV